MLRHIRNVAILIVVLVAGTIFYLSRGDKARLPETALEGWDPKFTPARPELLPTVKIADPIGWKAGEQPTAAAGLTVSRFADGLSHPRRIYRLPNGDLLVAETNSQPREDKGIRGFVMRWLIGDAGAGGASPDRIVLLRDSNADGKADARSVFIAGLKSPYGMTLVGSTLYVANTDALLAFPYRTGDSRITAKPIKIIDLPANAPNQHWTRNVVADPTGSLLYVSVGSNSNIAEGGMAAEKNRAAILEVDPVKRSFRVFASGMRNPVGMAWEPNSNQLWAVVNERDMLGSDLPPDYLTRVELGAFYGWPYNYWGGYIDHRVEPQSEITTDPYLREYTHRPDYGVGSHTAPLGLTFSKEAQLGPAFANGAFVGLHGSWNRKPAAGYKVIYVPFTDKGQVVRTAKPVEVLKAFLDADGNAKGRPVDVAIDGAGALLVSDDIGGVIWRVTKR